MLPARTLQRTAQSASGASARLNPVSFSRSLTPQMRQEEWEEKGRRNKENADQRLEENAELSTGLSEQTPVCYWSPQSFVARVAFRPEEAQYSSDDRSLKLVVLTLKITRKLRRALN